MRYSWFLAHVALQLGTNRRHVDRRVREGNRSPGASSGCGLMRLGIDAREISGKPTGVGRYLGGLLREWTSASATHGHEIVLYAHRALPATVGSSNVRVLPGGGGTTWEQGDLRRAIGRDAV